MPLKFPLIWKWPHWSLSRFFSGKPRLGRFLSPDPYVQAPDFSQSFIRYSYVWNNPMKYVDPSGEWIDLALFLVGSYIMGAWHFDQQPDGSFDWKKANQGGLATMAISGTMVASFALPALIPAGVGALPGLMLAGGQLTSTSINTGAWSWITTGSFTPNWKAAAFSAAPGLIMAGIGGVKAMRHGGNFLTGKGATFDVALDDPGSGESFLFSSDDELREYLKNKNVNLDDFGVNKLTAWDDVLHEGKSFSYVRLDDGYIWKFYNAGGAKRLGGFTEIVNHNPFSRLSNIYMSRIPDLGMFIGSLNHELIHAYHIFVGVPLAFGNSWVSYSERIAYTYTAKIGLTPWIWVNNYSTLPRTEIWPPYLVPFP